METLLIPMACWISIHALREEGDPTAWWPLLTGTYFYPRPPRGGRRIEDPHTGLLQPISIHALREEGDLGHGPKSAMLIKFLSTPSARRATKLPGAHPCGHRISIHALREEGDTGESCGAGREGDFYPRPPRGGRLIAGGSNFPVKKFLSTPSARRATSGDNMDVNESEFLSTPSARRATCHVYAILCSD